MSFDTESTGPIQITLKASPKTLYNHLVDVRNHVAWNHQLVDIKQATPGPIQVGTVFKAVEQARAEITRLAPAVQPNDYYGPRGMMKIRGYPTKVMSSDTAHNLKMARRLWQVSEELTGVKFNPPEKEVSKAL